MTGDGVRHFGMTVKHAGEQLREELAIGLLEVRRTDVAAFELLFLVVQKAREVGFDAGVVLGRIGEPLVEAEHHEDAGQMAGGVRRRLAVAFLVFSHSSRFL